MCGVLTSRVLAPRHTAVGRTGKGPGGGRPSREQGSGGITPGKLFETETFVGKTQKAIFGTVECFNFGLLRQYEILCLTSRDRGLQQLLVSFH